MIREFQYHLTSLNQLDCQPDIIYSSLIMHMDFPTYLILSAMVSHLNFIYQGQLFS